MTVSHSNEECLFVSEGCAKSKCTCRSGAALKFGERRCRVFFFCCFFFWFLNKLLRAVRLFLLLCNPCGTPSGVCVCVCVIPGSSVLSQWLARCCCSAWLWQDCRQDAPCLLSLFPSHTAPVSGVSLGAHPTPGLKWQADLLRTSPLFLQNKSGRPQHPPPPPRPDLKHPFYLRSGPHLAGGEKGRGGAMHGPPCAH